MTLAGKVVVVSGASRGIGAASARELARRGANVVAIGLEPELLESLATELGPRHAWFDADVTDQESLDLAAKKTVEVFGRIDALLANAGVVNYGTVLTADPDSFAHTIDVNLTGVYRTIAATLPYLRAARGYALMVGSVASLTPLPGANAYAASKSGIDQLARGMRIELSGTGIDVGIAYPSWVDTDMVRNAEAALPAFKRMRDRLPWPVRSTSSVDDCARALATAVERRSRRVFFPRHIAVVSALRSVINSPLGETVMVRRTADLMPEIDDNIAALGTATQPIEQGT